MSTRYVVLGLARPRSPWFTEVGRWATAGSAPLEFIRCVAREEVAANLASGRPYSAVLVDGGTHGLDRDLIELARDAGSATIIVADASTATRDWQSLGAQSVLPPDFSRADLVLALEAHAAPLPRLTPALDPTPAVPGNGREDDDATRQHRWVSVVGAGAGTSVLAMALAQELAGSTRVIPGGTSGRMPTVPARSGVVLADLALDADQAVLHAAPDIVPGVSELVEAFRAGRVGSQSVRELTFAVDGRGYDLLLGLRRHRDWAALRPRATQAALDGLAAAFPLVVADVEPDLEGEPECGSVEIEERNLLARSAVARADVVVAVGTADLKGLHALVRLLWRLRAFGVPDAAVVPVVNRAPRHPRLRAELTRAVRTLGFPDDGGPRPTDTRPTDTRSGGTTAGDPATAATLAGVVLLPNVRRLDQLIRDGARLPDQLGRPVAQAVRLLLAEHRAERVDEPQPVRPGELGRHYDDRAAS